MKKSKKIFIAVGVSIALAVVIAYVVLYFLFPEETNNYTMNVWYHLNEPLPVVGVSVAFIGFFIFKIIASSSFGKKKYNQLKVDYKDLKSEYEKMKVEYETYKEEINKKIDVNRDATLFLMGKIKEICDAVPNKRVKELGESLIYGEKEETTNDQTTTN